MSLLRVSEQTPIQLQLRRDLVRSVKRGHSWIYADALRTLPKTQRGVSAILLDNRGGSEVLKAVMQNDLADRRHPESCPLTIF